MLLQFQEKIYPLLFSYDTDSNPFAGYDLLYFNSELVYSIWQHFEEYLCDQHEESVDLLTKKLRLSICCCWICSSTTSVTWDAFLQLQMLWSSFTFSDEDVSQNGGQIKPVKDKTCLYILETELSVLFEVWSAHINLQTWISCQMLGLATCTLRP